MHSSCISKCTHTKMHTRIHTYAELRRASDIHPKHPIPKSHAPRPNSWHTKEHAIIRKQTNMWHNMHHTTRHDNDQTNQASHAEDLRHATLWGWRAWPHPNVSNMRPSKPTCRTFYIARIVDWHRAPDYTTMAQSTAISPVLRKTPERQNLKSHPRHWTTLGT